MPKQTTWLCALAVGIVAFVTYLPALKIQFYDGWWNFLIWSATMDLPRYVIQFFDPANITVGYRPIQGLYMYLLYHLFGFNPDGYHLAHNLLHTANSILLFLLVLRLGKKQRLAFVAAIIYAVLPNYSLAVFWHAVVDPLVGFFYLLTLLLWTQFLETQRTRDYVAVFIVFVLALLSKEIAVFLPVFLFLTAWFFYGVKPDWRRDIPRYAPFVLMFLPYLWLVVQVQSHGEFVGQFGFRIGPHMINNLIPYMAVLAFPWTTELPTDSMFFVWLAVAVALYVGVMVYKRSTALLFLALFAILNISPLLGFPQDYFNTRYLYLSTAVSAIVLALVFESVWKVVASRRVLTFAVYGAVVFVVLFSSARVADAAAGLAEYTRQVRVPFRDISREHATFPADTYLYFVHSPLTTIWDFEGLFFSRYGGNPKVNGTDSGSPAELRAHATSFVYYFDSSGKPEELLVDKNLDVRTTLELPVRYAAPISLEKIEIVSTRLERSKALVAVLNWRALDVIERNYTIFAHLIDEKGNQIAQFDSQPWLGKAPTSTWERNRLYVDAVVLPIPPDAPAMENLRLEIGMYNAETMERLSIVDANGNLTSDKVVIEPFSIVAQ